MYIDIVLGLSHEWHSFVLTFGTKQTQARCHPHGRHRTNLRGHDDFSRSKVLRTMVVTTKKR